MNNFKYENQGCNTYLCYSLGLNDVVDTMTLGMITNNRIPGFAQALYTQIDNVKYIKFNISAKITVKDFFTGSINRRRLLGVFEGVVDAFISAEEYMVDPNTIVMDTNYIYTDVSTCETTLVCLPLLETAQTPVDMLGFFRNIMFSHQFDQTENCDYIARIINYLNSTPVFSLYDFKKLLDGLKTEAPQSAYGQRRVEQPAVPKQKPQHVVQTPAQPAVVAQQPAVQQPVAQAQINQAAFTPPEKAQAFQEVFGNNAGNTRPPVAQAKVQAPPAAQPPVDTGEKISLFQLLSHYNKENAALYKAQKAAKKAAQQGAKSQPAKPSAPPKQPAAPGVTPPKAKPSFAIPGQPTPPPAANRGFAVPGQPTPPPTGNRGFAVPGQSASNVQPAPATSANHAPDGGFRLPAQPAMGGQVEAPVIPAIPVQAPAAKASAIQMPDNFGETTVLGGSFDDETTVLNAEVQNSINPHLIRIKNDERIPLNKPLFRLGKERSFVDYFIGNNPAVSRSHANIVRQGDSFGIVDANSTNHTYVNNVMIPSGTEHPLKHGDKIRLANEEFLFQLY